MFERHEVHRSGARKPAITKHLDIEHEIGALASRHGISVAEARAIIERCGADASCIDLEARKLALAN